MAVIIPAGALAERQFRVSIRAFQGTVVFRQVRQGRRLWEPSADRHRWSEGSPALYTSLDLSVAFAERIKYTGAAPTRLEVGEAKVMLRWVADLTDGPTLRELGVTVEDVTSEADARSLPRRIGAALYRAGASALLVPAAIGSVSRFYPRYRVERTGRPDEVHETPASGTNLVIFPNRLRTGEKVRPDRRSVFTCRLQALIA